MPSALLQLEGFPVMEKVIKDTQKKRLLNCKYCIYTNNKDVHTVIFVTFKIEPETYNKSYSTRLQLFNKPMK